MAYCVVAGSAGVAAAGGVAAGAFSAGVGAAGAFSAGVGAAGAFVAVSVTGGAGAVEGVATGATAGVSFCASGALVVSGVGVVVSFAVGVSVGKAGVVASFLEDDCTISMIIGPSLFFPPTRIQARRTTSSRAIMMVAELSATSLIKVLSLLGYRRGSGLCPPTAFSEFGGGSEGSEEGSKVFPLSSDANKGDWADGSLGIRGVGEDEGAGVFGKGGFLWSAIDKVLLEESLHNAWSNFQTNKKLSRSQSGLKRNYR